MSAARRLRHLRLTSVPKHFANKHELPLTELPLFTGFEIILLGTGAGMPSIERGATSVCLQLPKKSWLIDCGEGALRQMFRSTVRAPTVEKIFLTHTHGDHIFGLPGMLCTLNALGSPPVDPDTNEPTRRRIEVFGPPGVFDFVNVALNTGRANMANVLVHIHELMPVSAAPAAVTSSLGVHECLRRHEIAPLVVDGIPRWHVVDDGEHSVVAGALRHSVPSLGYVIEEKSRSGRFDVDAAVRRGLRPGPLYKQLKDGHSVPLPDGTRLHPHEVIGPSRRGRKIAVLGDSSDSTGMYPIAQNVDVLVHEATLAHSAAAIVTLALERGHSTSSMAGHFAKHMNATLLVLTHFSSRFSRARLSSRSVQQLVDEARVTFRKRAVVDGFDLMRIPILAHGDVTTH
ncbi:Aste57867_11572 [Aphanomyces stellatus]|uniref:Aste57867_11572 protein n=1 Tax=Aphanomyces stellatus TaxID=120398 RepID=A0A485KTX3_9STRA|nr:hypothetical protein As57867_011529 [Aphanomyces stellatus]VFT88431.1 Aste57867_11572 [Aphanomyces stellatus]